MSVITRSRIYHKCVISQGVVNGRWVMEVSQDPDGLHPAGTLVSDPAPDNESLDVTFTAPNGRKYYDVPEHVRFTPRG